MCCSITNNIWQHVDVFTTVVDVAHSATWFDYDSRYIDFFLLILLSLMDGLDWMNNMHARIHYMHKLFFYFHHWWQTATEMELKSKTQSLFVKFFFTFFFISIPFTFNLHFFPPPWLPMFISHLSHRTKRMKGLYFKLLTFHSLTYMILFDSLTSLIYLFIHMWKSRTEQYK